MPERFKVVCIPCKALQKCSALPALNQSTNSVTMCQYSKQLHTSLNVYFHLNISEYALLLLFDPNKTGHNIGQ